jgi:hypothetical protein
MIQAGIRVCVVLMLLTACLASPAIEPPERAGADAATPESEKGTRDG